MTKTLFRGTFLEKISRIAETGDFVDDFKPMKEGEVVIVELTDMEKAFWTFIERRVAELQKARRTFSLPGIGMLMEISMSPATLNLGSEVEQERKLFWRLVRERLESEFPEAKTDHIGLRQGMVLVSMPPEPEEEEHDCGNCPGLETCELELAVKYRAKRDYANPEG